MKTETPSSSLELTASHSSNAQSTARELAIPHADRKGVEDRFWTKVEKRSEDECWPWRNGRKEKGYGRFWLNHKTEHAHRVAHALSNGDIPADLHVMHTCDNPQCCNPAHLVLGNNATNIEDMVSKDRQARGPHHGRSKLDENAVSEIRRSRESLAVLSRRYGVHKSVISRARRGDTWRDCRADARPAVLPWPPRACTGAVYKPAPGSPIDEALRTGLKDAKLFDVHKWSRAPWTRDLANDLYVELFGHPHGRNADSRWRHLVIWLNDLYFKSHRCPGSFSAISLDKDEYTCGRYNKLRLSYRHTKSILDGLSRRGYIETFRGFRDPDTGVGYRTRIRATRPLLEFFDLYGFQPDESLNEDEREVIVLKDAERRKVEYKDDHTTLRYRQFVDRYNEFLRETTIDLDRSELATDLIPDLSQKRVWRVFNNGSWVEGGRFYGPWWQTIHSSVRDCILINGKPTVEIDYRGIHVLILYAKEGLDYAKQGQGDDPYRLETAFGSDWCDSLRALAKIALLILVNASDRRSAIKAIRREAAKEPLTKRWSGEIVRVVDALVARHAAIAKHFFSGAGLRLQFDDAQIAERVIGRFLELRKPILSIHDSFVVMEEDRELLRKTMTDTAVSYLLEEEGVEVTVSLKERLPKL